MRAWIDLLTRYDFDKPQPDYVLNAECTAIIYRPQLLIAVTNSLQEGANQALKNIGFIPSKPVHNKKYGSASNLINWTYELNPMKEEK